MVKILKEKQKTEKTPKTKQTAFYLYIKTFAIMCVCLGVVFSYVYQSTEQIYLNYEISKLNKEIQDLDIELRQSKVENQKLQTNENIEKLASEKLGMTYENADRIIVVKEEQDLMTTNAEDTEKSKILIFMNSLYSEMQKQLKQFNLDSFTSYFTKK